MKSSIKYFLACEEAQLAHNNISFNGESAAAIHLLINC